MKRIYFLLFLFLGFIACDDGFEVVPNNEKPYYDGVPTELIENYVSKLFIDLLGREPLDIELEQEVNALKNNDLSQESRQILVEKLQTGIDQNPGDTTYKHAYYHRLYDLLKLRFIEGASRSEINSEINTLKQAILRDSLNGDWADFQEGKLRLARLEELHTMGDKYREGQTDLVGVCNRLIYNGIYDIINMNTFNFINATFDDLYFRFPSQNEFDAAFQMIEYNQSQVIFTQSGQNKADYVSIVTSTREFYEGNIIWVYRTLLAREPSTSEKEAILEDFFQNKDLQKIQKNILIGDEYANFN